MLVKWVVCTVPNAQKKAFHQAQLSWKELVHVKGFLGQMGGWDLKNPANACIISLWDSLESYQSFMENEHDEIYGKSQQGETYDSIQVHLFEKMMMMNEQHQIPFFEVAKHATILRVTECLVKKEHIPHFLMMQECVWNLGMEHAPGMLKGIFAESIHLNERFLVCSLWRQEKDYKAYEAHILPALLRWSKIRNDLQNDSGWMIRLEKDWLVG